MKRFNLHKPEIENPDPFEDLEKCEDDFDEDDDEFLYDEDDEDVFNNEDEDGYKFL
jgi:hypothetical protein